MRLLILAVVILLIDWFSFQAIRVFAQEWERFVRVAIYSLFWLIPVLTLTYIVAATQGWTDGWPRRLQVYTGAGFMILYLSKFFVGSIILIDDIRRLFAWLANYLTSEPHFSASRSRFLSNLGLAIGSIPLISLTYGIMRNPYRYQVYRTTVPIRNLNEKLQGLKIVQISDIHSGSFLFKDPVRRSVAMINELEPDVVFFTGDLVNTKANEMDNYTDVFGGIRAKYGVYSICGNHDYGDYHDWPSQAEKRQNFEDFKAQHRKMGWNLLMNEHRVLDVGGAKLGVVGVENYSANRRFHKYGDLAKAVSGMPETDFSVLLSHDPSHWTDQVTGQYRNIQLTLSGHTHGFQFGIEIPGFKWSPVQYAYKEWAGLYEQMEQYLYVNRGLGFIGYPGRVGILPEITLLTLENKTV